MVLPAPENFRIPALIVVPPVYELTPLSVHVPLPLFTTLPEPPLVSPFAIDDPEPPPVNVSAFPPRSIVLIELPIEIVVVPKKEVLVPKTRPKFASLITNGFEV
jgi:hypothetical protein